MSVPTLRWLHIHQYEQFEPVRIQFSPRENLLLGVNGAGKTRLLKLIRAVLSLDFGDLLDRAFDVEFELQTQSAGTADIGEVMVKGRVKNAPAASRGISEPTLQPSMDLTADIAYERDSTLLHCTVRNNEITYRHDGPKVAIEKALLTGAGSLKPTHAGLHDPDILVIVPRVNPRCEANYLGESDHEFDILSREVWFTLGSGSHVALRTTNENGESLGRGLLWDLLPLLLALGKLDPAQIGNRHGLDLSEFSARTVLPIDKTVFSDLFSSLGVRTVRLVPNIARARGTDYECRGIDIRVRFLDDTEVAGSELTFGQRRYLYAGIVFAFHPATPVLVDEIDNGLHPRLLRSLLDLWKNRQLFIVSHNNLVIDFTNFFKTLDVQEKVHIIKRAKDGRQSILSLDNAIASEIYEKIEVGIQNPSEVLRAEGLW